MAFLKDTVVAGDLRVTDTIYGNVPLSDLVDADDLKAIEALSGTTGILKKTAANTWTLDTSAYTTSSGVTSVTINTTSPVSGGSSTAITSTGSVTISLADGYGDTKNPYASKNAGLVLAAPASAAGAPTFRALTATDIPSLTVSKISDFPSSMTPSSHAHGNITNAGAIGTAANKGVYTGTNGVLTAGTIPIAAGGTGATSTTAGGIVYGSSTTAYGTTAAGTSGQYLKSNATSAPTWASFVTPVVTWAGGTTAGPTLSVKATGGTSTAVAVPSAGASASGIVTTGAQTIAGAKTFTGDMTISKSTTIESNSPATLNFSVTQTDNNKTTIGSIKVYDDADNQTYGTNMVIQSTGAVIIGGGESPSALYTALGKTYTQENLFLTADGSIFAEANANTIANRIGFQIDTSGNVIPVKAETGNNNAQSLGNSSYRWAGAFLGNASSAWNTNGVSFTKGSRMGENTSGDLGIYAAGKLYIKPSSGTAASSTEGMILDTDGLYPVVTNTENLGKADNKWANVYATKVTLGADPANALEAATKQYVDNSFAANDAMIFKGTIGTGGTVTSLPNTHNAGWTYRVITAGTYANIKCEIGDLIICVTDGTAANNAHWTVAQTNIDGAVVGPTSATSGNFVLFDGTTGKLIKNSDYSPSSFAASGHDHDSTYLKLSGGTLSGALTLNADPTANLHAATKQYVDSQISASSFSATIRVWS